MKRRGVFLFLALQSFYPLCLAVAYAAGRDFRLSSEGLYLIAVTAASLWAALTARKEVPTRWVFLSPLLTVIHILSLLVTLGGWLSGIAAAGLLLGVWILFETGPKSLGKSILRVLFLIVTLPLLGLIPFWILFGSIGVRETVQTLPSPGERYTATLINADQGALGGDTIVYVRDNRKTVPILVGSFGKEWEVYRGEWFEWETMDLVWEDEGVLSINGTAFSITDETTGILPVVAAALEVPIENGRVLHYQDSHGGFLGDGLTYAEISCTLTVPRSRFWHSLPLAGNAAKIPAYLSAEAPLEQVETGAYFFRDRHTQRLSDWEDTELFSRSSCNFTFAVYDEEAGILYYYKMDT